MAENGAAFHTLPLSKQDGVRLPGEVELTPLSGDSVLGVRYHAQGTHSVRRLHAFGSRY